MTQCTQPNEHFLSRDEECLLLRIARDALTDWVSRQNRIDLLSYALTPALQEPHGAFVTLRKGRELRGCIGYTQNRETLARVVMENAINASSKDPRFDPVQSDELPSISIEISALTPGDSPETPFKLVRGLDEIIIGRDGLYIEMPPYRGGLLLPQVAAERGWSVDQFLRAVCQKAGYPDRAWEFPDARLYRFSAQVFGEEQGGFAVYKR
ncbi:MAG: AmmeMemoRadiSam system protein A [Candidatus Hydrogenedentes bacterium]|nr:AmmeMemoRadiSam system protein A [Candidatus Hydrogenedentota bacterium]